jgi:hypothetical protein
VNERFEQMIDRILAYKPPSKVKQAATQSAAKKKLKAKRKKN